MNHAFAVTWRCSEARLQSLYALSTRRSFLEPLYRHNALNSVNGISRDYNISSLPTKSPIYKFSTSAFSWPLPQCQEFSKVLCAGKSSRNFTRPHDRERRQYVRSKSTLNRANANAPYMDYTKVEKLSIQEIREIFGGSMSSDHGNRLIRNLQKRRVTGTLDYSFEEVGITEGDIAKGLQYLRTWYPLDEDAAIMKRIEREDEGSPDGTSEYMKRAEELGLYKPQASARTHGVYGVSQFEKIRKENEARWEAELSSKKKAASEKGSQQLKSARSHERGNFLRESYGSQHQVARERKDWVKRYEERAKLSSLLEPPKMTKAQRLVPSWVFAIVCILGALVYASLYEPPSSSARLFPDVPPAAATMLAIIALNVNFWIAWKIPQLWRFMNLNALMIVGTPRAVSALGSVFSHQTLKHLSMNMIVLWYFGTKLHDEIGRGNFMALYLSCGIFGSVSSLTAFVLRNVLGHASLGASGAVAGIISCYLYLHANDNFNPIFWPGDKPSVSGQVILMLLLAAEVFALGGSGIARRIDNYSHLGGMIAGIIGAYGLKYKAKIREKQTRERALGK